MSDEGTGTETGQQQQAAGGGDSYTPPASQADLDRIISDRLARERAKFADYDDLKAKASKLDEQEQASKTELQKAIERAEAAEKRAATNELAALKASVAAEKGVPASSLAGSTKEELEKAADDLIAWRDQQKKTNTPLSAGALRSGSGGDGQQLTGKEKAAAALRALRADR
jgi:hypothetical protein